MSRAASSAVIGGSPNHDPQRAADSFGPQRRSEEIGADPAGPADGVKAAPILSSNTPGLRGSFHHVRLSGPIGQT